MLVLNCEQGSPEWIDARLGIPTASQFHRIITPKTGKLSASAETYAFELLAEDFLGHPIDEGATDFMARGTSMERNAVEFYEFNRDVATTKVGTILRDDGLVGCSPDRLVGEDGGLELKCPSAVVHVGYMLGADADKYRCQVQGALWITGRQWWDWMSFNPELPPVIVRHQRDEEFIARIGAAVDGFVEVLAAMRQALVDRGYITSDVQAVHDRRRADVLALAGGKP